MADAEDLKSSGDFSSCGFDSHPGHHCLCFSLNQFARSRRARNCCLFYEMQLIGRSGLFGGIHDLDVVVSQQVAGGMIESSHGYLIADLSLQEI